jgi:anti-anti-sigma factor
VFEVRHDPDQAGRFKLVGELDLASAPQLLAQVTPEADQDRDIVLDLRDLTFVDSTGISSLISLSNRLSAGSLTLERPTRNVARVLRLVRAEGFPNVQVLWED